MCKDYDIFSSTECICCLTRVFSLLVFGTTYRLVPKVLRVRDNMWKNKTSMFNLFCNLIIVLKSPTFAFFCSNFS